MPPTPTGDPRSTTRDTEEAPQASPDEPHSRINPSPTDAC